MAVEKYIMVKKKWSYRSLSAFWVHGWFSFHTFIPLWSSDAKRGRFTVGIALLQSNRNTRQNSLHSQINTSAFLLTLNTVKGGLVSRKFGKLPSGLHRILVWFGYCDWFHSVSIIKAVWRESEKSVRFLLASSAGAFNPNLKRWPKIQLHKIVCLYRSE